MFEIATMLANAGVNLVSKFIDTGKDKAISVIKEKTGIDLSNKAKLNEQELLKLKEFENKNKEFLLNEIKLMLEDRQNARQMQTVALNQEDKFSKRFIYYFAFIWSMFAMIYMVAITFYTIPETSIRFADTIQGFLLGTIVAQIIAFFYGSSLGSKEKDEHLKGIKK